MLIGDPGRSYLPREKLASLGEYSVPSRGNWRIPKNQADAGLAAGPELLSQSATIRMASDAQSQ